MIFGKMRNAHPTMTIEYTIGVLLIDHVCPSGSAGFRVCGKPRALERCSMGIIQGVQPE